MTSTLLIIIVIGLLGGIAVGVQSPLSSMIGTRLGSMESVFIIHLGGAIVSGIFLLARGGGKLADWRSVPWYALAGGALGLVVIMAANYIIPRRGAVVLIFLIVAGQLLISVLIDQFGWLDVEARSLDVSRLVGLVVLFVGVWLIVR